LSTILFLFIGDTLSVCRRYFFNQSRRAYNFDKPRSGDLTVEKHIPRHSNSWTLYVALKLFMLLFNSKIVRNYYTTMFPLKKSFGLIQQALTIQQMCWFF